jgi:hypothetical protein
VGAKRVNVGGGHGGPPTCMCGVGGDCCRGGVCVFYLDLPGEAVGLPV